MSKNFKAASYQPKPNPIAKAMQTTRAFGVRKLPNKTAYRRCKIRLERITEA